MSLTIIASSMAVSASATSHAGLRGTNTFSADARSLLGGAPSFFPCLADCPGAPADLNSMPSAAELQLLTAAINSRSPCTADCTADMWGDAGAQGVGTVPPGDLWGDADGQGAAGDVWGSLATPVPAPLSSGPNEVGATGWIDYWYGCKMGDIRYGNRWYNSWIPKGCTCWESKYDLGLNGERFFTGRKCDHSPDGMKIYDSYYSGEAGYYLVQVPSSKMPEEMLKEINTLKNTGKRNNDIESDIERYWQSRGVPTNMRGLWWTSYNNGVMSFLHNMPAEPNSDGKLVSNTVVFGQNVWSWSTTTLYTIVDTVHLNYRFMFSKTGNSNKYNHADIIPDFTKLSLEIPGWLSEFSMKTENHCANCRAYDATNNPFAGEFSTSESIVPADQLTAAQASAQLCAEDQCWRRYTTVADKGGDSSWEYDVVKIVDQYGRKIEPAFSNWVKSLKAEDRKGLTGSDYSLLARCSPKNNDCAGDTKPGEVGVLQLDWSSSLWGM